MRGKLRDCGQYPPSDGEPDICILWNCIICFPTTENITDILTDLVDAQDKAGKELTGKYSTVPDTSDLKALIGNLEQALASAQDLLRGVKASDWCWGCEVIGAECHCECDHDTMHALGHESCTEIFWRTA